MKDIEEIFGGANAEEQNVLLHIIKKRGYKFFEETPKTTMTVRLLEDLHELGYEIKPKAKNNEVLDIVSQRELLNELINNQKEIISSPIRFNGVSIEKIKQIFEKNGMKYESPF